MSFEEMLYSSYRPEYSAKEVVDEKRYKDFEELTEDVVKGKIAIAVLQSAIHEPRKADGYTEEQIRAKIKKAKWVITQNEGRLKDYSPVYRSLYDKRK